VLSTGFFLAIDLAFFSATLLKIADGGWFPLVIGAALFTAMTTWRRGREHLFARVRSSSVPLEAFLESLFVEPPQRVPGTAVFLTATPDATPHALLHNLNHNKVLHERVVFLTVEMRDEPWVPEKERVVCQKLAHGCWRVRMSYGFMDRPDVTRALKLCAKSGIEFEMMETSFFLSRELIVPVEKGAGGMALWRDRMFAAMARNAGNITDYFNIPTNRVIELGTRVQI
jgi:KUP system potassium uptake protein